ncbi:putative Monocarboxylate transporter 14 [Hypsibius exemplaris]|uniref:Monocarboxylate transporter 14 n=1 Tax=Hypsibius exemplaris TaxID=2072580 RepID=A0A9X6NAX7_HYPEX|nr:putative Monocarboxylate transporter 14 [Hypsibius exemplaris]
MEEDEHQDGKQSRLSEKISVEHRRVATPPDIPRGPSLLEPTSSDPLEEPQWRSPSKIGHTGSLDGDGSRQEKAKISGESEGSKAPDGGYGWVIVFAVFCIHVILDGIQFSFGMLLPRIVEEFHATQTAVSWVVSFLMGTTFFCGPVASFLSEKYGHRIVAIGGAIIAFVGAVAGSFSTQVWHLAISYGFLMGVGFGGIYLPAIVSVATWFDKRRALAMGIAVCGSGIGIFALSNLIPIFMEEYGLHGTLLLEGAIVFNALIFSALLRPLPTRKAVKADKSDRRSSVELENLDSKHAIARKEAEAAAARAAESKVSHKTSGLMKALPFFGLWEYWVMLAVVAISGFSGYIPFSFLVDRAEKEAEVERKDTALLVSICGGLNLVGRLLAGVLAVQPWCNRYLLYLSAFIISGVGTFFSIYCTTFTAFAIYGGVYGFTGGIIIALQSVVMTDIVGIENFSKAFGISLLVLGAAALGGTPTAGAIVDANNGSFHLAFMIFGALMAVGGVVFLPVPFSKFLQACVKRRSRNSAAAASSAAAVDA